MNGSALLKTLENMRENAFRRFTNEQAKEDANVNRLQALRGEMTGLDDAIWAAKKQMEAEICDQEEAVRNRQARLDAEVGK